MRIRRKLESETTKWIVGGWLVDGWMIEDEEVFLLTTGSGESWLGGW